MLDNQIIKFERDGEMNIEFDGSLFKRVLEIRNSWQDIEKLKVLIDEWEKDLHRFLFPMLCNSRFLQK